MLNQIKGVDYETCRTQGEIFEEACKRKYDMEWFYYFYLNSDFCERAMDSIYSRFQMADGAECLDFIIPEIGENKIENDDYFGEYKAYKIGLNTRYMALALGISSKTIAEKVPYQEFFYWCGRMDDPEFEEIIEILAKKYNLE